MKPQKGTTFGLCLPIFIGISPPPPHPRVNIPVQYTGVYGVKEQSLNKSGKGQFIFLLSMTSYFVLITYGALQGAAGAIP